MLKRRFLLLIVCLLWIVPAYAQEGDEPDLTPPVLGEFDADTIADVDLADYPILPELTGHAQIIFERGQEAGRNAAVFSKVGDSMTASESFLVGFAGDDYDLGEYDDLQDVIDYILENSITDEDTSAFDRVNYATELGFSTVSALDPMWAVADACEPNESPLVCEYRTSNAAFALMMFGTNDVLYFDQATFDFYMRTVVLETIAQDVVPVLYTFPIRPEEPEATIEFNKIIVRIAEDYDLPLINLVSALEDLPDMGVDLEDPLHLTIPAEDDGTVTVFNEATLQAGYTVRNLVTLQALDHLLRELDVLPQEDEE